MVKYLLDTNFLIYCVKEKIDFLEELGKKNILVAAEIIEELERIKNKGDILDRSAASIVIMMLEGIKKIALGEGHVDDLILDFAKKNDVIIGTMDKNLQKRVKKNKGRILELVGRKKLRLG